MTPRIAVAAIAFAALLPASLVFSQEKLAVTPKEQVEELMNEGITFAEKMLRDHGEFHPFGMARKSNGSITHVGASDGNEYPAAHDLISLLNDGFRAGAESGEYSATAIFIDVRTTPPGASSKTDAVQAGLEHRDGYCVDVFFPYTRLTDGSVTFGEVFAARREAKVFACQ